ncbi:hypothetical protein IG631_00173 [Alternaria alternata]|nr:hypothetical protein IG631_00173 [Alternaria alternata]
MHISLDSQAIDQRENDRREREAARIAVLPANEQQAAIDSEVVRQRAYESRPRHMALDNALYPPKILLPPLLRLRSPEVFICYYPGCNAAPFQTQYLLKYIKPSMSMTLTNENSSHTNIHSSNRPHYCPVADCPRAKGGKGFKRKNEMIRHGLVHQSPGYICPFCPDREHKYPRPDNLQRQRPKRPSTSGRTGTTPWTKKKDRRWRKLIRALVVDMARMSVFMYINSRHRHPEGYFGRKWRSCSKMICWKVLSFAYPYISCLNREPSSLYSLKMKKSRLEKHCTPKRWYRLLVPGLDCHTSANSISAVRD